MSLIKYLEKSKTERDNHVYLQNVERLFKEEGFVLYRKVIYHFDNYPDDSECIYQIFKSSLLGLKKTRVGAITRKMDPDVLFDEYSFYDNMTIGEKLVLSIHEESSRPALERFANKYQQMFNEEIEITPEDQNPKKQRGEFSISGTEGNLSLKEGLEGALSETEK